MNWWVAENADGTRTIGTGDREIARAATAEDAQMIRAALERTRVDPMDRMTLTGWARSIKPREIIAQTLAAGFTRAQAKDAVNHALSTETWGNSKYTASVDRKAIHGFGPTMFCIHVSLHRHDREPCTDWREFQQIKTDILGADAEAVELFPAEDRIMDTANEYHLWAFFDVETGKPCPFPFGWTKGLKTDNGQAIFGSRQRAL